MNKSRIERKEAAMELIKNAPRRFVNGRQVLADMLHEKENEARRNAKAAAEKAKVRYNAKQDVITTDLIAGYIQEYHEAVAALKIKTLEEVKPSYAALRDIVAEVTTEPLSADAMTMVQALKMVDNPTEQDIELVLEKYGTNYTAAKIICDMAKAKGIKKGVLKKIISTDEYTGEVYEVPPNAVDTRKATILTNVYSFDCVESSELLALIGKVEEDLGTVLGSASDMTYNERLAFKGRALELLSLRLDDFLNSYTE